MWGEAAKRGELAVASVTPVSNATADPALVAYIEGLTRVRAAAGAVVLDEHGAVLVVKPVYKTVNELPGGVVELDESPRQTCERELKEELGFVPPLGEVLCIDWVPPAPPWDGGLMFLFDGGVLSPAQIADIRLPEGELASFSFVPVDQLETVLIPRLARRVLACLPFRGRGGVYLEDGVPRAV